MNPDTNEQKEPIEPADEVEPTSAKVGKSRLLSVIVSIVTGSVAGIFLHYVLYLMSIPQKPFIYAWF